MSDGKLIRLEDAISAVNGNIWWNESEKAAIRLLLRKVPTVEAEEVVHGQWVGEGDGYADGEIVYDVWYCSECNHCIDDGTDDPDQLPGYCPGCGAKMDKDNLPSGDE